MRNIWITYDNVGKDENRKKNWEIHNSFLYFELKIFTIEKNINIKWGGLLYSIIMFQFRNFVFIDDHDSYRA